MTRHRPMRRAQPPTIALALALQLLAPLTFAEPSTTGSEASEAGPTQRRWRPAPLIDPDTAPYPQVDEAMRSAPPNPPRPLTYRGEGEASVAARTLSNRTQRFGNYRATSPLATWRDSPELEWRIRAPAACYAELRRLGVGFQPWTEELAADAEDAGEEEEAEPADPFPSPSPVIIRSQIGGVRIIAADGRALLSCEMAARLHTLAQVAARHGVTRVMLSSTWRPTPSQSFHTLGLAVDIPWIEVEEPLRGADGRGPSRRLVVATDFVETPDRETCDPALLDPEGALSGERDERARRLLAFACDLFDSGAFSTVLTPNYNEGHRGHFHLDTRPDDPRAMIR